MKNSLQSLILVSLLFISISSCKSKASYEYRLGQFYQLVGEENTTSFKKGELSEVTTILAKKYEENSEFKKEWDAMKSHEGINFFSIQEVVEFYYNSFHQRKK